MTTVVALSVFVLLLYLGAPIFLALGAAGVAGLFLTGGGVAVSLAATSFFAQLNNFELLSLPFFILMGYVLVETPMGRDLFRAAAYWLNWLRGSLAISSVGACAIFGAVSGVSIAGVAAIGALAVPEMMERGYSRTLSAGSVVTAGALAMLIPPSVPFIVYSAVSGVSIADLFIGGIVPGIVLALALSLYIFLHACLHPEDAPMSKESVTWRQRLASLGRIWHVLVLMVLIVGSIYTGLATPTEASAFGVLGAFFISGCLYKVLNRERFARIMSRSVKISSAILLIMGCAKVFGDYLNLIQLPERIADLVTSVNLPAPLVIIVIMMLVAVLGMLVDAVSLIVVVSPILLPVVLALGYDPLWFGIVLVLNLEMAVVTPPVGLNLYTLQGVCPFLSIEQIIRSSIPFVLVQAMVLLMFVLWPSLSLWLPHMI